MYKEEMGYHIEQPDWEEIDPADESDAEEAYLEEWAKWIVEKNRFRTKKGSRPPLSVLEQKEIELKERDPLFAHLAKHLDSTPAAERHSYVENDWLPSIREHDREIARRNRLLHRYPSGYRHYENYQNYRVIYPERSLQDYANDINSQITFEDFFAIAQKDYLYDAEHDPEFRLRMGFNTQPDDTSYEEEGTAECIVR